MRSVRVITFPHDDAAFRVHVTTAHARMGRWDADAILREVRPGYPRAVVRKATSLARHLPDEDTWYAFRDGAIMPAARESWWDDEALPRTVIAATGEYLAANEAAAELFGVPRDEIPGARIGRFTRHESSDDAGLRAFDLLARTGLLQSTAVVARPAGDEVPMEYRIVRTPDGNFTMVMRRI